MARKLDQILVIDIESTCWDGGYAPRGQISEIIEVGLCMVDTRSLKRGEKRSIMVKPMKSHINEFCTGLTSITPEMVERKRPLSNACAVLEKEYESRKRLMASWGDYDRKQFERNCGDYNLRYPFGPTHLNVKTLFSLTLGLDNELDLDAAFAHLGWELDGPLHRGVDDAWNTAKILIWLLDRGRTPVATTSPSKESK